MGEVELRKFLQLIYKYRLILILTAFFSAGGGFLFSLKLTPTYMASMVVYVRRAVEPPSSEYFTFEGFYSQQAAREYTDTVIGFFKSQDLAKKALESIDRDPDIEKITSISSEIQVKKLSPHLLSVSLNRPTAAEAEKTISALVKVISEEIIEINRDGGDEKLSLATIDNSPSVEEIKPRPLLNTALSALIGLILAISLIAFREYLREL